MIISKTPFRISFVGGGTDIADFYSEHGGAVVSAAINKYMYVTVNRRFYDSIRVSYSKTEIVDTVDEVEHELARECLRATGVDHAVEITSVSDIPKGTGLGSSSVFTVGLLNALYLYQGMQMSAMDIAEQACRIEIDVLGSPIGKQDQYAAACGGLNLFEFHKDGSVNRDRIHLRFEDYKKSDRQLMMFYTGGERSANAILREQKGSIPDKAATMLKMRDQAYSLSDRLRAEGWGGFFADYLAEGWEMKRTLAGGISNPWVEECHARAMAAGALGGKLLGAGGSGFLLFYVPEERQDDVRRALGLRELHFTFSSYGTRIICSD